MREMYHITFFPALADMQESFFGWVFFFNLFKAFYERTISVFPDNRHLKIKYCTNSGKDKCGTSLRAAIIFPEVVSISAVPSLIDYRFEDIALVCWCPLSWDLQLCSVCCVIWVPSAAYNKESTAK